ncbi:RagB/SusD family nutrient uptake outer membrane protein [Riemerella anatipestifer]|uniref:RagB/SusD family nutrient uptake outer membrane protein n=1 Tax=Riemerella anatipestifer TaxID=34085 RepID=UPI00129D2844|nr:RagB/SusD family nutrient uptake outer membrane protein [Riemerella anatipestifer]MCU7542612.1 RagB/SusD family nutrient uptake outer membrane protein [Riemerella anatipestifer]MCW0513439.1 RagB/SusD family nutrient uptake outer membrane protein [Riemerella anatipestifer]MRM96970.1 RagB/SusD family nutrient uptake outer membrane protein [Riemerella anatipestifer]MRN01634.1 RagB/SusD family nutrient uptake outer membrane protein [Riemerella anatipestifer]MRN03737.1 RagB/SusD family nutrient 
MKNKILNLIVLSICLSLSSCRKDFLDTQPTETLPNPPAEARIGGIYPLMVTPGVGGTNRHDDFGQKGIDIYSDMLSSDMVLCGDNYGWYSDLAQLISTRSRQFDENYISWRYYYRLIFVCNNIIHSLGGEEAIPTSNEDKYAIGQVKALRAYCYFYLLQLYTNKYEPSGMAIPLSLKTDLKALPKSTQKEIYDKITKDLESAVDLLKDFKRPNKGYIDQDVAKGILVYVYSTTKQHDKAAKLCDEIIGKYPLTTEKELTGGFNDINTPSWMWKFDSQIENSHSLASWWGQMDIFTYSYPAAGDYKAIDDHLYNKIDAADYRKNQFLTLEDPDFPGVAYNKFYDADREIQGRRIVIQDYIFMRVDEFHLLKAENLAFQGDMKQAKDAIKSFVKTRMKTPEAIKKEDEKIDKLSAQELKDYIYLQTRIELWGEGKSYLAMKRNQATITRGKNHLFYAGMSFQYDANELTFEIPEEEILNNPHIR